MCETQAGTQGLFSRCDVVDSAYGCAMQRQGLRVSFVAVMGLNMDVRETRTKRHVRPSVTSLWADHEQSFTEQELIRSSAGTWGCTLSMCLAQIRYWQRGGRDFGFCLAHMLCNNRGGSWGLPRRQVCQLCTALE
jgi:hypothetical protein